MRRVLEVFGEPVSYGGQEAFFFNVLQHMDKSDLKIDVFTPYYCDNEESRKTVQRYGGELIEAGLPFEPGKSRSNICEPLAEQLKKKHYDAVHIHSGSISVLALASMIAKKNNVEKIIVHSHCTGIRKDLKYRLTKRVMTPLLDSCPTDYCACSVEAGEWKFSSRAVKKMLVLKNGIDLEKFRYSPEIRQKMREQLGIRPDEYVIGHVGRFSFQKNQEFIIDLMKDLRDQGINAKTVLVGNGETFEQIRKQTEGYGLSDDVLFIGNVSNVQDYLQAMDIFVFPSRFEGLPIVGVEAQANGLPVIASTNVSKAMQITPLVEYYSLENRQDWIARILSLRDTGRADMSEQMKLSGYDIADTARAVRKLYFKQAQEGSSQ